MDIINVRKSLIAKSDLNKHQSTGWKESFECNKCGKAVIFKSYIAHYSSEDS